MSVKGNDLVIAVVILVIAMALHLGLLMYFVEAQHKATQAALLEVLAERSAFILERVENSETIVQTHNTTRDVHENMLTWWDRMAIANKGR